MKLSTTFRRHFASARYRYALYCGLFWFAACVAAAVVAAAQAPDPAGWTLVWADEFDDEGLPDPARWTQEAGAHG